MLYFAKDLNPEEYGSGPAFCDMGNDALWPMIIEKAYAKIYGNYEKIESAMFYHDQFLTFQNDDEYDFYQL